MLFEVALQILKLFEPDLMEFDDAFDGMVWLNKQTATLFDADRLFAVRLTRVTLDAATLKVLRYYEREKSRDM